jgi:hypothetical protein
VLSDSIKPKDPSALKSGETCWIQQWALLCKSHWECVREWTVLLFCSWEEPRMKSFEWLSLSLSLNIDTYTQLSLPHFLPTSIFLHFQGHDVHAYGHSTPQVQVYSWTHFSQYPPPRKTWSMRICVPFPQPDTCYGNTRPWKEVHGCRAKNTWFLSTQRISRVMPLTTIVLSGRWPLNISNVARSNWDVLCEFKNQNLKTYYWEKECKISNLHTDYILK